VWRSSAERCATKLPYIVYTSFEQEKCGRANAQKIRPVWKWKLGEVFRSKKTSDKGRPSTTYAIESNRERANIEGVCT